jgi:hypothetical protein
MKATGTDDFPLAPTSGDLVRLQSIGGKLERLAVERTIPGWLPQRLMLSKKKTR